MNPISVGAISAAVAFAIGTGAGYRLTSDHFAAKTAKAQEAAAAAYRERTEELNAVSAELEKARHERRTVYKTITQQVEKVVTRDVYRNVCLDDGGVQLINDALAGRASAGQPAAAVPAADSTGGNDRR